jgi:hypothetical protein
MMIYRATSIYSITADLLKAIGIGMTDAVS